MKRSVHVARVDPESNLDGYASYRLTLSCGCTFWEFRPINDPAPETEHPATCFVEFDDGPLLSE